MNHDNVQNPQHYTEQGAFECIEIMQLFFSPNEVSVFCLCNAFKYLWRAKYKNNTQEDLQKANWYLKKSEALSHTYYYAADKNQTNIRQQLRLKLQEMNKATQ
ncbi:MAG: DUF3310 domain-containing protein [Neisseriaceae bacterium]|nr:DUF3310 domain-containing protein [Neisseriaceae bacterium]MBQ9683838.1 DUF3310 domain-containing protein [Neisseriaceae bacterium]MBQ9724745.1 DUF3310 domain-containing protein [Neisseriaceae bacterium]